MSTARTHALAPLPIASALAGVIRQRSSPLTLGMVFPFSNHNFDLRYWLAAAGVHPDRDVRLVAIPPPLMVESLRAGHVDGFCVGEPRNSLAVEEGIGQIVLTKSQIFPRSIKGPGRSCVAGVTSAAIARVAAGARCSGGVGG